MVAQEKVLPVYPAVGEVFELTLDGDAPENQPLAMVQQGGYNGAWQHKGLLVTGRQARRFKLVQVGQQPGLVAVGVELAVHGRVPPGQWREALKATYRQDGQGPVGVADPSWQSPFGRVCFPYINTDGSPGLALADLDYRKDWRWLVEVPI